MTLWLAMLAAPSPPITLTNEVFHVAVPNPKFFHHGDVHLVTGTASEQGGTLTVHCPNGTVADYTVELGQGKPGPWYNHSFVHYATATTSLKYPTGTGSSLPVNAAVKLYYDLSAKGPFGQGLSDFAFSITEKGYGPEAIGDLRHGANANPPPPPPPLPPPPPSPPPLKHIKLASEPFHVTQPSPKLFRQGDVHVISGTATGDGGTLTVHCLNGTVADYTVELGQGKLGPWYNHSANPFITYANATTSLQYKSVGSSLPVNATVKLYYDLSTKGPFGQGLSDFAFFINEKGFGPEAIGDLRHGTK